MGRINVTSSIFAGRSPNINAMIMIMIMMIMIMVMIMIMMMIIGFAGRSFEFPPNPRCVVVRKVASAAR